jgi:hypothetical protein
VIAQKQGLLSIHQTNKFTQVSVYMLFLYDENISVCLTVINCQYCPITIIIEVSDKTTCMLTLLRPRRCVAAYSIIASLPSNQRHDFHNHLCIKAQNEY